MAEKMEECKIKGNENSCKVNLKKDILNYKGKNLKIEAKTYQSPTGSPYSILSIGDTEVAVKSYDKLSKIKNPELYKEFLKLYPGEPSAVEI